MTPSAFDYRNIIDSFKAGRLTDLEIEKRLSNLMLFFDFSASLNQISGVEEIAHLLVLTLLGHTASRRSLFLLRTESGFKIVEAKGYRSKTTSPNWKCTVDPPFSEYYGLEEGDWKDLMESMQLQVLIPLHHDNRLLALVGLGEKTAGHAYSQEELQTASTLVQMCAGALANARTNQTLHSLNRQLNLKIYQLNTLFELSKDFNAVWDPETIFRILGSSLIGQLLISRCSVLSIFPDGFQLRFQRGFKLEQSTIDALCEIPVQSLFADATNPTYVAEMPAGILRDLLNATGVHLIVPMSLNNEIRGVILLGAKRNKNLFSQEDFDFIATLANLALVSEENARMQLAMIEKQRMERELAIARDIQVGLLPHASPEIDGYEIATVFHPCYSVAGDYFDFLPISKRKVGIAIGDVSGKSTPAALIMACLQASLRTIAAMEVVDPVLTIEKINQLLCKSQSSNKYVTFFYGILNHETHCLSYVNAGHCYPLVVKTNGNVDRLDIGGTVLGFFKDAAYRTASYQLDPGDTMILYTDGVSEMINEREEEFGVEGIIRVLKENAGLSVDSVKDALVSALQQHRQEQPQGDDTTFILLKRL